MTTEPKFKSLAAERESLSPIENEIPAYRAISPGAVVALLLGGLSILSYAHYAFLAFAVVAVVAGFLADRKIQRMGDVFTGRSFAQAGMALGLIFGLTSLTIGTVQTFIRENEAKKFAKLYETVLVKGAVADAFFYGQRPEVRKATTPEKLFKEMTDKAPNPEMMTSQTQSLTDFKSALATPGADAHFSKIEATSDDGTTLIATALYELHNDKALPPQQTRQFALAILRGKSTGGKYDWWVEELRFPYTPSSFVAVEKPVDDGHGH